MFINEIMASVSAATDRASSPQQLDDLIIMAIQVQFTGVNVVGTLKLQASCLANPDQSLASTDWVDVDDSTQAITASSQHMWNIDGMGFRWIRAVWDYTSGTGNIAMYSIIKQPYNRF